MKIYRSNNEIQKELFEKLHITKKFHTEETAEDIIEDALQEAWKRGYSSCEEDQGE